MAALHFSQMRNTNHLFSLPYSSLIKQLIHIHKSHQSLPFKTLLSLSANHDCQHLFQIFCKKHQQNKMDLWEKVTKEGLMEMFGMENGLKSGTSVAELNSQYFKQLQQRLLKLKQDSSPQSSLHLAQSLFFYLPQVYPYHALTPQHLKSFRQNYTKASSLLLPLLTPTSPTIMNLYKMFPPQFFNVTNQPLVKDIYKKFINQRLSKQTIGDFCGSVNLIGRMGLQGGWFVAGGFEKIRQMIKNGNMRGSLGDWMQIANCLFLGVRKCGIEKSVIKIKQGEVQEKEYYNKNMKENILLLVQSILEQIPITKQIRLKTIKTQTDANNFIRQLKARIQAELQDKQNSTTKLIEQLYDVTENTKGKEIPSDLDSHIKIKISLQIFRYFATLFHLQLSHSNSLPQIANQSVQIFFNCKQMGEILKQIMYHGDTLAEIEYLRSLCQFVRGEKLFKNKFDEQVVKTRNDMRTYIDHLQSNLGQIGLGVLKRADNMEYLLSGLTRLKFRRNVASEKSNKAQILTKCLLNDCQFLSHYGSRSFKSLIATNLNTLHFNFIQNTQSKYPYFPSFLVTTNHNKNTQIYVKDNFCKHSRVDYQNEYEIIDCTQVAKVSQKIQEFKKKSKLFM